MISQINGSIGELSPQILDHPKTDWVQDKSHFWMNLGMLLPSKYILLFAPDNGFNKLRLCITFTTLKLN